MLNNENKKWQMDLEEYIRLGEPEKSEKSTAWKAAIGLQDVDGLKTSEYLLETAKEHIEGKIDIKTAGRRIESYYEERLDRSEIEEETKEADIVAARIAEILGERTFQFSPAELKNIHKRLFRGVFEHAGIYRTYNISKKEWVLNGDTVYYASADSISETLDYDFRMEKEFSYENLSVDDAIKHISKFTSGIWQIHPFCEGNTRTTAVFVIKYLKSFGYSVNNEIFAENSWYFRNALVRANYNNYQNGITATLVFLDRFYENLILGTDYELKNRYMHVDYNDSDNKSQKVIQSAKELSPKSQNGTLEMTLEETAIIKVLQAEPSATQKRIAELTGKSERTIKRRTVEMQEKGFIKRENGRRNGIWEVLIKG